MNQYEWLIFVDGAARGNPGPAGAGIYVLDAEKKIMLAKGFYLGIKTNNQAEYLALIIALYLVDMHAKKHSVTPTLHIYSDSELLIKQMKNMYKVRNSILIMLKNFASSFLKTMPHSFHHVRREKNKHADALANQGIDNKEALPKSFVTLLKSHMKVT